MFAWFVFCCVCFSRCCNKWWWQIRRIGTHTLFFVLLWINSRTCQQKWEGKLKEKLGLTNVKAILGQEQLEDFKLLKSRVTQHLNASDYQWIRPEMWKSVFGVQSSSLSKRILAWSEVKKCTPAIDTVAVSYDMCHSWEWKTTQPYTIRIALHFGGEGHEIPSLFKLTKS